MPDTSAVIPRKFVSRPVKRKLIQVVHVVPSLSAGGMENGVVNVCNGLDGERFAPAVCVLQGGQALEQRLDLTRVRLVEVRRRFGNDPVVPFRLARAFRRLKADVVHTHGWGTLVEGVLGARMARVPAVVHGEHGTIQDAWRHRIVQRWFWPRVDRVLSVSEGLARKLVDVVGVDRDRITVIANGVDTHQFRPLDAGPDQLRRQFDLPTGKFLIGIVARLVPVKNHAGLLDALAELHRQGIEAHLAIAGDGSLREKLQAQAAQLGLADRVHFLGMVRDVCALVNALDVFVLNSHCEGMSNTVLEAMACGTAVVATNVGGNPELVADSVTGRLVPPDDPNSLADALMEFCRAQPLRTALGSAARARVLESFSVHRMIERYSELYCDVVNEVRLKHRDDNK